LRWPFFILIFSVEGEFSDIFRSIFPEEVFFLEDTGKNDTKSPDGAL
jgi:hypothetical protein